MNEKEIIEEIKKLASDLSKCVIQDYGGVYFLETAKALYEQGYRKIPEGSVVLSGKQCVEIVQDNYNIGYERGSKETAKEIIEIIKEMDGADLNYIAQKYGVEE